jgi:hypothetical protein
VPRPNRHRSSRVAGDDEIPKLLVDYVHHILAHLFMRCKNMELFDPPARFLLRETSETYDMTLD